MPKGECDDIEDFESSGLFAIHSQRQKSQRTHPSKKRKFSEMKNPQYEEQSQSKIRMKAKVEPRPTKRLRGSLLIDLTSENLSKIKKELPIILVPNTQESQMFYDFTDDSVSNDDEFSLDSSQSIYSIKSEPKILSTSKKKM